MWLRRVGWVLVGIALLECSSWAALEPGAGYSSRPLTLVSGSLLEGLDVRGDRAVLGYGTRVESIHLDTGATNLVGQPTGAVVSVAFVKQRGDTLHAAYGTSFNFPFPAVHGVYSSGVWRAFGTVNGIYDAAVDASNTLYLVANPGGMDTRIYRYVPETNGLVQVIQVGGFSGGIAFDSQGRLYAAEQVNGHVLRFTPEQLALGNLTAAHGEVVVPGIFASYLCFDEHDRLFVVSGYGNRLTMHDAASGALLRDIAVDGLNGYGIGRIGWDARRNQLLVVHSDYSAFASTLEAVTFAASFEGIPGTSSVFRGWVAGYRDFIRPEPDSGGYMLDNTNGAGSVAAAVVGAPASFDPEEFPVGHILSLGNGGSITLLFDDTIYDGPGADFAVFENGFDFGDLTFSEFAFVEVATTTNAWARFPVTFHDTNAPGLFKGTDATRVDGLAGKHTLAYGTPFDLAWLRTHPAVTNGSVDLNRIAYVRIVDAVGDGSTADQFGQAIVDPYSETLAATDGFELRGVGVIHLSGVSTEPGPGGLDFAWYGYPGRSYQVEIGDGFSWAPHGDPVSGTGGVHRLSLPTGDGKGLFRLIQTFSISP